MNSNITMANELTEEELTEVFGPVESAPFSMPMPEFINLASRKFYVGLGELDLGNMTIRAVDDATLSAIDNVLHEGGNHSAKQYVGSSGFAPAVRLSVEDEFGFEMYVNAAGQAVVVATQGCDWCALLRDIESLTKLPREFKFGGVPTPESECTVIEVRLWRSAFGICTEHNDATYRGRCDASDAEMSLDTTVAAIRRLAQCDVVRHGHYGEMYSEPEQYVRWSEMTPTQREKVLRRHLPGGPWHVDGNTTTLLRGRVTEAMTGLTGDDAETL